MSFIKNWWFVPVGLLLFFGLLMIGEWWQEREEGPKAPEWSPNGDPLVGMDHHNLLVCATRLPDALEPDIPTQLLVSFMGGMGGGQQLKLYPSQRGLCGVLDLRHFGTIPVQVMLNPVGKYDQFLGFTATYWEPTRRPEPDPPYAWATAALTEREERWWIQVNFRSAVESTTTVTLGVE